MLLLLLLLLLVVVLVVVVVLVMVVVLVVGLPRRKQSDGPELRTSEAGAASCAHAHGKGKYSLPGIHYKPVKPTRENPCRLMKFSICFGRSRFWPSPVQSLVHG